MVSVVVASLQLECHLGYKIAKLVFLLKSFIILLSIDFVPRFIKYCVSLY